MITVKAFMVIGLGERNDHSLMKDPSARMATGKIKRRVNGVIVKILPPLLSSKMFLCLAA